MTSLLRYTAQSSGKTRSNKSEAVLRVDYSTKGTASLHEIQLIQLPVRAIAYSQLTASHVPDRALRTMASLITMIS